MLSPSITPNSNGNCARAATIRSASWNCPLLPVPLSPITRNLTDPSARGSVTDTPSGGAWRCAIVGTAPARDAAASRPCEARAAARTRRRVVNRRTSVPPAHHCRNHIQDVVHDQVRLAIEQYEVTIEEAILESLRQWVEIGQQSGRHSGTRRIRRPRRVHPQWQCDRHLLHRGERVTNVALLQVTPDDRPELRDNRGREDVAVPGLLARRADGGQELLLVRRDLFGCGEATPEQ